MSKKETRRAARQAFPKAPAKPSRPKTYGQRPSRSSGAARKPRSSQAKLASARASLKPPSWKRAVRNGAILVVLYLVLVIFFWKDESASTLTYVIMAVVGFIVYSAVSYGVDKFTYQRRLRKLEQSHK